MQIKVYNNDELVHGGENMNIIFKDDGNQITADVVDGENYIAWVSFELPTFIKFYALVSNEWR